MDTKKIQNLSVLDINFPLENFKAKSKIKRYIRSKPRPRRAKPFVSQITAEFLSKPIKESSIRANAKTELREPVEELLVSKVNL